MNSSNFFFASPLHHDVLGLIADHLPDSEVHKLSSVNKQLHTTVTANYIWERRFALFFPEEFAQHKLHVKNEINWSKLFAKHFHSHFAKLSPDEKNYLNLILTGDLNGLKKLGDNHSFFSNYNTQFYKYKTFLDIAKILNQQHILDFWYNENKKDLEGIQLLRLAITFNQTMVISKLLACNDYLISNLNDLLKDLFNEDLHQLIDQHPNIVKHAIDIRLQPTNIGAQLNKKFFVTQLMINAAKHNHTADIKFLLSRKDYPQFGSINTEATIYQSRNYLGESHRKQFTSLHYALENGCNETAFYLIMQIKDSDSATQPCYKGNFFDDATLLQKAISMCSVKVVKALFEVFPPSEETLNGIDFMGRTLVHFALENDDIAVLDFLIQEEVNLNTSDQKKSCCPLITAIQNHNDEYAKLLFEAGAKLDEPQPHVLLFAASNGCIQTAKAILEKDPSAIDQIDADGHSALMHAVMNGHNEIVKCLLSNKASLTFKTKRFVNFLGQESLECNGFTALHWACKTGHEDIAVMLLDQKADFFAKSDNGKTPFDLIEDKKMKKRLEIYKLIAEIEKKIEKKPHQQKEKRSAQLAIAKKIKLQFFSPKNAKPLSEEEYKVLHKSKKFKSIAKNFKK